MENQSSYSQIVEKMYRQLRWDMGTVNVVSMMRIAIKIITAVLRDGFNGHACQTGITF